MATLLHLVRHASHGAVLSTLVGRNPGAHLSEAGQREAEAVARRLAGETVAAVHASPRERAAETAAPIAAILGLTVATEPLIDELDVGAWSGRSFADLSDDPDWRHWNMARALSRPPGGEDVFALQSRMMGYAATVADRHPDAAVVAVSHAEPIRALVLAVLGLGPDAWSRIEIAPASLSTIAIEPGPQARIVRLNERPTA